MLGLWLEERTLRLRDDLPSPVVAEGEARVDVRLAGICATDLELLRGYSPFTGIPGHEFVGVVEQGPDALRGRRVVGEINASCGDCRNCRSRRAAHCERRTVLGIVDRNGAFAEQLCLPVENLHLVPDEMPDEVAVFVEPLAAALEIREQIAIAAGERVLIIGDGKLGQLIARVLVPSGCLLQVVGRQPGHRARLAEAGIVGGDERVIEPAGHDVVIECTGDPAGFELARRAVRPRGTIVLKSTYQGRLTLDASSIVVDEITLVGSRCGPFRPALGMLERREVDPTPLIDARYPLARARDAFDHARQQGTLKVLIEVGS